MNMNMLCDCGWRLRLDACECGRGVCSDCRCDCDDCGRTKCPRCMYSCYDCGEAVCRGCLTSGGNCKGCAEAAAVYAWWEQHEGVLKNGLWWLASFFLIGITMGCIYLWAEGTL